MLSDKITISYFLFREKIWTRKIAAKADYKYQPNLEPKTVGEKKSKVNKIQTDI